MRGGGGRERERGGGGALYQDIHGAITRAERVREREKGGGGGRRKGERVSGKLYQHRLRERGGEQEEGGRERERERECVCM